MSRRLIGRQPGRFRRCSPGRLVLVMVDAWDLTPGDELPDGFRVTTVYRQAQARTIQILTDEPVSADLPSDSPVPVVRRLRWTHYITRSRPEEVAARCRPSPPPPPSAR